MMSFQGKRITLEVKILTIDVEKGPAWWVRRPTLATRIVSAELKSGGWKLSCREKYERRILHPSTFKDTVYEVKKCWWPKTCLVYEVVLYYYDRMFTLCYMLHLLFTGQDVHDLKLHVTEQENVHFEPKFTGWSIRPLAD